MSASENWWDSTKSMFNVASNFIIVGSDWKDGASDTGTTTSYGGRSIDGGMGVIE